MSGAERGDKLWRLPESLSELEEVSYELSGCEKARFEEVATLSIAKSREVAPVFLLPGLRPQQIQSLASRLQFPAYQVKLPEIIHSISETSHQLVQVCFIFHLPP